jgi:hypothetical protein
MHVVDGMAFKKRIYAHLWLPGDDGEMAGSMNESVLSAMRSSMNAIHAMFVQSCKP